MRRKRAVAVSAGTLLGLLATWLPQVTHATSAKDAAYEPHLKASDFSTKIDNRYFPLPVGWTWIYRGVKEGKPQVDRVVVTSKTQKVTEGITARVITDVSKTP